MRVKQIFVGVKSLKQGLSDFTQAVKSLRRGTFARRRKPEVYFVDVEAMRQVLTPRRVELLQVIREKHPESVYDLARLTKRDLKNVQQDVTLLSRLGLVGLTKPRSARRRLVPHVDYDNLQVRIPVFLTA